MAAYNPTSDELIRALIGALGPAAVRVGDAIEARHQADWSGAAPVRPLAWVRPADTAGVAATLRLCHAHRAPVVPQGGLTGLAGGAVPLAHGVALSLERMNGLEPVDPAAATLTVQAGVTLQAAQEAAAAAGFQFGVDLGARGSCQIGGNLATNAGGNGVLQFGMMREQVLGLEVVLSDGTVLDMMRPMLKNNTGYDLKHWFVGSEGTLGIITRAILKLQPATQASATALAALPDYAAAVDLLACLRSAFAGALGAYELMWEDFFTTSLAWGRAHPPFDRSHPLVALIQVSGRDETGLVDRLQQVLAQAMEQGRVIDAVLAQNQAQARALWRIREATEEFPTRIDPINFDISLPIGRIGDFAQACVEAIARRWPGHRSLRFGHLGDGNLHLTTDARSLGADGSTGQAAHELQAMVYGLLAQHGGSISAEHGIGLHKKPYLHLSRSPAELAAMRAIKLALDPLNLLNPGKIIDLWPRHENAPMTTDPNDLIRRLARPEVRELPAYNAGLSSDAVRRRFGVDHIARLGSNENPFGPSPAVAAALGTLAQSVGQYPDANCVALRSVIGARAGVPTDAVVIGNGSENLLELLCLAFLSPGDRVVTLLPSFGLHEIFPRMMGAQVDMVPVTNAMEFDTEAWCTALGGGARPPRMAILSNPSNPVGCMLDAAAFHRIVQAAPPETLLVIDEAYYEYARLSPRFPDALAELRRQPRPWIVLRTFSKAWGLAGLRVGYGLASDPGLVQMLDRVRTPFNVNLAAQSAALAAWGDPEHTATVARETVALRETLRAQLRDLGVAVAPSAANFLFVNVHRPNGPVAEALLARGVIVKPWKEAGYEHFIRVSVGAAADNRLFVAALADILRQGA